MCPKLTIFVILLFSGALLMVQAKPNPQNPYPGTAAQTQPQPQQPQQSGVCNMLCIQGSHCELCHGTPKCVMDNPPQPQPQPVTSCAAVLCPTGTTCQQDTIQCFAAPCPQPRPRCVPNDPNTPTCDNVRCQAGTYCQLQQVQCIRAPCPPQPTCVPCGPPVQQAGSSYPAQSQPQGQSSINPCPIG